MCTDTELCHVHALRLTNACNMCIGVNRKLSCMYVQPNEEINNIGNHIKMKLSFISDLPSSDGCHLAIYIHLACGNRLMIKYPISNLIQVHSFGENCLAAASTESFRRLIALVRYPLIVDKICAQSAMCRQGKSAFLNCHNIFDTSFNSVATQ